MRINDAPYIVDLTRPEAVTKEIAPAEAVRNSPPAGNVRSFDRVEVSSKVLELERLKKDLAAIPEVRLDRVALAKQHLQEGGYRVDPAILAQRMMEAFGKR